MGCAPAAFGFFAPTVMGATYALCVLLPWKSCTVFVRWRLRCATCLRVWLRTCLRWCFAGSTDGAAALTVALASVRTVADGAGEEALPDGSTANAGPAIRVVASKAAAKFLNMFLSCCLSNGASLRVCRSSGELRMPALNGS